MGVPLTATLVLIGPGCYHVQEQLNQAREQLRCALGETALVDAAATVATFNMITRIVDASGHEMSSSRRWIMGAVGQVFGHHRQLIAMAGIALVVGLAAACRSLGL